MRTVRIGFANGEESFSEQSRQDGQAPVPGQTVAMPVDSPRLRGESGANAVAPPTITPMSAILIATQRHTHLQPEYNLKDGKTRVGRHPENEIAIMLESISRFHAEIIKQGNFYLLQDCQSRNGTYLNGDRLTAPCPIRQGDRIQFGNVEFIFRLESLDEPSAPAGGDTNVAIASRPSSHSVLHTQPVSTAARDLAEAGEKQASGELTQRVSVLYQILLYLRDHDAEEQDTMKTVLRRLFDVLPADRAAILTRNADGGMEPAAWLRREESKRHTSPRIVISQSICEQAVRQEAAVLVGDAQSDERFKSAESIAGESITSAICVPLITGGRVYGLLYLDTQDTTKTLRAEDLGFSATIAAEVSYAIWHQQEVMHRAEQGHEGQGTDTSAGMGDILLHAGRALERLMQECTTVSPVVTQALADNDVVAATGAWKQVRLGMKRLGKVLSDMIEFGTPLQPRLAPVEINRVVKETLDAFRNDLAAAGIKTNLQLQDGLRQRLLDEEALCKALISIIENAYEALLASRGTISFRTFETAQGALILEVADDGPGLPPQIQPRAFQPFNAGPGSRSVGMGLANTRRLVEALGGSVTLATETTRGTTVTMIFPPTTRA